jgi:hypothetical protein
MNHARALSLALLLGSLTLSAQSHAQKPSDPAVLQLVPLQNSCPIDMRAQQGTNGTMLSVENARPKGLAQLLHLTVTNSKPVGIVAAEITVHGFTAKGRAMPALSWRSDSAEATKTFDLRLSVDAKQDASTDLWVRAFTAISFIELNSVTYSNGSSWHSSPKTTCQVELDGLMEISRR